MTIILQRAGARRRPYVIVPESTTVLLGVFGAHGRFSAHVPTWAVDANGGVLECFSAEFRFVAHLHSHFFPTGHQRSQ